jgi:hypothetical protein
MHCPFRVGTRRHSCRARLDSAHVKPVAPRLQWIPEYLKEQKRKCRFCNIFLFEFRMNSCALNRSVLDRLDSVLSY